jgi:hypothetical protein
MQINNWAHKPHLAPSSVNLIPLTTKMTNKRNKKSLIFFKAFQKHSNSSHKNTLTNPAVSPFKNFPPIPPKNKNKNNI